MKFDNMDKFLQDELDKVDFESEMYWQNLDKQEENIDWDKLQKNHLQMYADMLCGAMGQDIKDVTSGKIKVKLPIKYKIKRWFENLFKIF